MTTTDLPDQRAVLSAAADSLRRTRDLQDAVAPLRRFLAQLDEDARAAALDAAAAGLTERTIAVQLGVTQPTVHGWLDERRSAPLPPPSAATDAWALHTMASAVASMAHRLVGRSLSPTAPSTGHVTPSDAARRARDELQAAADRLGRLGSALDYEATRGGDNAHLTS